MARTSAQIRFDARLDGMVALFRFTDHAVCRFGAFLGTHRSARRRQRQPCRALRLSGTRRGEPYLFYVAMVYPVFNARRLYTLRFFVGKFRLNLAIKMRNLHVIVKIT